VEVGNILAIEEILEKAKKIYQKYLDDNKIYWGALINVLVMFWWGVIKYFSSTTEAEKKNFQDYVLKRTKGIGFLYQFIKGKNKALR
jgi:hypothetical protein